MKTKLVSYTFISSAIASIMLLAGANAQAAPTRAELDEANLVQSLKEGGYSYPSIEEALREHKEAIARAEAEKSARALAKVKGDKAAATN